MTPIASEERKDISTIAIHWWKEINRGGSGSIAQLRRAQSELEILLVPASLRLIQQIGNRRRVAIIAGVLAHVRENDNEPIVRRLGRTKLDDDVSATLKEGRFRRLIQCNDSELLDAMRRLVHLNNNKADVRDLSRSILFWGDSVKRDWILRYYGVAPDHSQSTE